MLLRKYTILTTAILFPKISARKKKYLGVFAPSTQRQLQHVFAHAKPYDAAAPCCSGRLTLRFAAH